MSSGDLVSITFAVDQVWKGEVEKSTVVHTALSSASCGIENFTVDAEYVVYAYGEPDKLETNICDRTKLLANAEEDLAGLGVSYEPLQVQDSSISPITDAKEKPKGYYLIPIGGVVVILAFAFMVFSFRRKSDNR
ncbi:hypothetical protein [Cohnella mopanensis]|uniref:hypothetical protein n=1 Tax=Cohnella mopanensis TaxID=2911966 RepID=UPI001EF862BA|nr:hypothetical protein [Cohnella mopanensis]